MERPLPQTPAPALTVDLTNGETWTLREQSPDAFTMVVFYRGLHCPVCKSYLKKLASLQDKYAVRGVDVVAVSMDGEERARQTVEEWGLEDLSVGYGLDEQQARAWGLYLSSGISEKEPATFSEPGLFLVQPDGTLFYAAINSMPFGRPDLEGLLGALDFIDENDYPARGEMPEPQPAL